MLKISINFLCIFSKFSQYFLKFFSITLNFFQNSLKILPQIQMKFTNRFFSDFYKNFFKTHTKFSENLTERFSKIYTKWAKNITNISTNFPVWCGVRETRITITNQEKLGMKYFLKMCDEERFLAYSFLLKKL